MWRLYECSSQGRAHIKENIPCQDKTCTIERNGVYVISLADGAGSALMSHFGAEAVTNIISIELADNFESYWAESDVKIARMSIYLRFLNCLRNKASDLHCEVNDLASTLLAVAVNGNRFIIIHLGDGVVG